MKQTKIFCFAMLLLLCASLMHAQPKNTPADSLSTAIYMEEWRKLDEKKKNQPEMGGSNWTPLGPTNGVYYFHLPNTVNGQGRMDCMAFHPTNENILFAGSGCGGLWKSTDGGTSWALHHTDNLPAIGISDIVIAKSNPNIMFIATGDKHYLFGYCAGIMKSIDGGLTWQTTGYTNATPVHKLIIDEDNANRLFIATDKGLLKTEDGGTTWALVQSGDFSDVIMKPNTPTGYLIYFSSTTNTYKYDGTTVTNLVGFPSNLYCLLDMRRQDNTTLFLCIRTAAYTPAIYKYSDTTGNFTLIQDLTTTSTTYSKPVNYSSNQHYPSFAVSPTNMNEFYTGSTYLEKYVVGFNPIDIINVGTNNPPFVPHTHVDAKNLYFSPLNGKMFALNDGGIFSNLPSDTTPRTAGGFPLPKWRDAMTGLQTAQLYRIASHPTDSNVILVGNQDNGNMLKSSNGWKVISGGDGGGCAFLKSNPNTFYTTTFYGSYLYRSINGSPSVVSSILYNGQLVDLKMHPTGTDTVYIPLYSVILKIFPTSTGSLKVDTIKMPTWVIVGNRQIPVIAAMDLEIAKSEPSTIYGFGCDLIFKTTNLGNSWTNVSPPGVSTNQNCNGGHLYSMCIHPTNANIVYLAFDKQKVMKTTNGGASWFDISGSLPNIYFNDMVFDERDPNNGLYLATDLGVFYRNDLLSDWLPYSTNLPNAVVKDLDIFYSKNGQHNKLRAATFGRSAWETPTYNSVGIYSAVKSVEFGVTEQFKVYPNPTSASNGIIVEPLSNAHYTFQLFNREGQSVLKQNSEGLLILKNLNLPDGIYIYTIESNHQSWNGKLVIHK